MSKFKMALIQQSVPDSFEEAIEKSVALLREAAGQGAKVVLFPEIQLSPFFPQYRGQEASRYLVDLAHPVLERFRAVCREFGIVAVPNFYWRENGRAFDASPVIGCDGTVLGISKMVHVAQVPGFYEQDYYTPSDSGFRVYDTPFGRLGVVICFDRHYPESLRHCALQGAQLVVIPTANVKAEPLELFEWELRVPAMQNSLFIAMCNRVGVEGEMDFAGESLVVDPDGGLVAKADDREQILLAEIDLARQQHAAAARPYLALRRPDVCSLDRMVRP